MKSSIQVLRGQTRGIYQMQKLRLFPSFRPLIFSTAILGFPVRSSLQYLARLCPIHCSSFAEPLHLCKRTLASTHSLGKMRQSSLSEHLQSTGRTKRRWSNSVADVSFSGPEGLPEPVGEQKEPFSDMDCNLKTSSESSIMPELGIGVDWEQKVNRLLLKHFGYSSIKSFQKEALAAWLANQDCLVLAAKGAGKSLCYQIPALLTGKVVIVISPLTSRMHDQCLKLAKHGVSACFLGSGQPDSSVEQNAMSGMYGIIYVGPDTILRLIEPLQRLAENRGIALFAIDEVHCVSECGHDFRIIYRRLSILRENFSACNLKFLKFDIPLMALTAAAAAATSLVREDILESLCMSKETKIVVTSFFRPNLRFSVKRSRTSPSYYEEDFSELIDTYSKKKVSGKKKRDIISKDADDASDDSSGTANSSISEADRMYASEVDNNEDVACGEFYGQSPVEDGDICGSTTTIDPPIKPEERLRLLQGPLEHGPSIIYVLSRRETSSIAKYLRSRGVKAAAYHAKLRKSRLRQVHKDFHDNALEVVVATFAFGMGIDKLNVRRIIHYGWPQSLEAYYQEAGRAGRDGKLADCILYVNLSKIPTLLPSTESSLRNHDQENQAHKRLSDCFRYGMNTSSCRAKTLVEYFGEDFSYEKCLLCDVCVNGPPEMQNLKMEADAFMQVIAAHYESVMDNKQWRFIERPNIRVFVSRIREQFQKFKAKDHPWWRGLARLLEDKGYIRERYDMIHVQIEFPEPTAQGLEFMHSDQTFYVYPEADMLRKSRKKKSDLKTVRGISAKLSKQKQSSLESVGRWVYEFAERRSSSSKFSVHPKLQRRKAPSASKIARMESFFAARLASKIARIESILEAQARFLTSKEEASKAKAEK